MMHGFQSPMTEKSSPIPEIPKRSGALRNLWERFDDEGEKHVEEIVDNMNVQLDNLLLFAALFSAINTAFLVYTLPMLSTGPMDETNQLLILLVRGLNNDDLYSNATATATQYGGNQKYTVAVNSLFSASLTFSIIASFGAVLGKQWLTYYARNPHSNPEERRRELQRKVVGAHTWYLRALLEVGLSSVIQIALLLFTIGLLVFLQSMNSTVAIVNTSISVIGLAALAVTTFLALWDPCCPFQTPLTASILPGTGRFMVWATLSSCLSVVTVPVVILNTIQAAGYFAMGRHSRSRAKWLGALLAMRVSLLRTPKFRGYIDVLYAVLFKRWRRPADNCYLDAHSASWMIARANEPEMFYENAQAICCVEDQHVLDSLAQSKAMLRFHEPARHHAKVAAPQVQLVTETWLHIFVGTLDADNWWLVEAEAVLKRCRPGLPGPGAKDHMVHIPASCYIAAGIRFILDKRLYWMWRYSPGWRGTPMDPTDAMIRGQIISCISPNASPRVVSLVALAIKGPWDRKFRKPKPSEVRGSQREDYERLWISYGSDVPLLGNLAAAIRMYADHHKDPPAHSAWPSAPQFLDLLLAAKPYIANETTELQAITDGEELVNACAYLYRDLHAPDAPPESSVLINTTQALIMSIAQRLIELGTPSTELLAVEVQILGLLSQIYKDYNDSAILTAIDELLDHCHTHLHLQSERPKITRQGSTVVSAAGKVLEAMDSGQDDYHPFVHKVTDFIEGLAENQAVDWRDEGSSTTWASNATMLAMLHYVQELLKKASTYEIGEHHWNFASAYAAHVMENPRWAGLSEERTRNELKEALSQLDEIVNRDEKSPDVEKDMSYALTTL